MTSSKPSEGKKPRTSLKERLQKPGGISASEAIQRGQDALSEMRGDYLQQLRQDIAELTRLARNKPKVYAPKDSWWEDILRKLTDMRNVAGTFDYNLVTAACENLLDYLYNVEDDAYFDDVMRAHIDMLQHVATEDIRGKGQAKELEMLKELRATVKERKAASPFKREHGT